MNKKYISIGVVVLVIVLGIVFIGQGRGDEKTLTTENVGNPENTENKEVNKGTQTTTSRSKTTTTSTTKTTNTQTTATVPQKPASIIPTPDQLNGAIFELKSYNGVQIDPNSRHTVSFDKERLTAKFCNSFSGNYILDDGIIKVDNLIGTKMYCSSPSNLMDIETSFNSMLNFGGEISYTDNILILSDEKTIMMFTGFID